MREHWTMIAVGVLIIVLGFTVTGITGAMPGSKREDSLPVPVRTRLILIGFGVVMIVIGIYRLTAW